MMANAPRMDAFTRQYFETALWSSNDESDDQGGEPLDKNYNTGDIADETRWQMIADCADFQKRFGHLYDDSGQAGHDFWLSRNGHGTGFFDRDTEHADELQADAKSYGEFNLYVGDDGEIHGTPIGAPGRDYQKVRSSGHHVAAHRDPVDEQAATELVMYIENESDLSPDGPRGQGQSVRMNALRKWRNGTYDSTLGVKLFEYLAEAGAKRYAKEFGSSPKEWNTMFNPATRHEAARQLEASFRSSAENGEYDAKSGTVRDYEAVDNRDRRIAGPFKSYSDAKTAAGTAGVVKFVPKGKATVNAPRHYSDISAAIESWNRGDAYRDGSLQTLIDTGLVAKGRGGWAPTASGHRRGLSMDHLDHTGPREAKEVRSPSRSAHHPTSRRR